MEYSEDGLKCLWGERGALFISFAVLLVSVTIPRKTIGMNTLDTHSMNTWNVQLITLSMNNWNVQLTLSPSL